MKRTTAILLSAAMLCVAAAAEGCGNKASSGDGSSVADTSDRTTTTTGAQTDVTKDTAADAAQTTATAPPETEAVTTTTTAPAAETMQDEDIENLGAAMFEQACELYFATYCCTGGVYAYDAQQAITTEEGAEAYLVTDPAVKSLADVRAQFHQVFAADFPEQLDTRYTEKDGKLYTISGDRGSDIEYTGSQVKFVSKTEKKLVFEATSFFCNPDDFSVLPDQVNAFTLTLEADGWRVSAFTLPY